MPALRNIPQRNICTKLWWFCPIYCENCRMVIVPLPIRSLWPCCFKYMLKALGFFPSHLPLQEMSMQNLTLLWDAGFFFLFKCFQHLSLMPLYHHKAVKKCSLIIYVLCVEKFFSFIGHHKLPWGGGQKIFLKILCMCVCVCASIHFSRAELFESMNGWGMMSGGAQVTGWDQQPLQGQW